MSLIEVAVYSCLIGIISTFSYQRGYRKGVRDLHEMLEKDLERLKAEEGSKK